MNNNSDFYKWFETIATKLGNREISFRKIQKNHFPRELLDLMEQNSIFYFGSNA